MTVTGMLACEYRRLSNCSSVTGRSDQKSRCVTAPKLADETEPGTGGHASQRLTNYSKVYRKHLRR